MIQGNSDDRALATGRTEIPPEYDPVGAPPVQAEFTDKAKAEPVKPEPAKPAPTQDSANNHTHDPALEKSEIDAAFDTIVKQVDNTYQASREGDDPQEHRTPPTPVQEIQNDPNALSPEDRAVKARADNEKYQEHQLNVSGVAQETGKITSAAGAQADNRQSAENSKAKESEKRAELVRYLAMAENARAFAAARGAEADNYEAGFEAEFGDAWRGEIALRVMDADEIPLQREGESIADYNQRLEDALIEKMIDPKTGEIKLEFANDPANAQYAAWAKARYDERLGNRVADILADPNSTMENKREAEQDISTKTSFNQIRQIDQKLSTTNTENKVVVETTDGARDVAELDTASSEMTAFGRLAPS